MSFLDKIAAAVAPAASDESRAEARRKVEALSHGEEWLRMIVEQHKQIEALFREAKASSGPEQRRAALDRLAIELTGHANAEEAVVYPIVSEDSGKTHAGMAYEEHAMTKVQLSKLERMDPSSKEWAEKLEHVQSAVQQHIYQEENSWLPDLVENTSPAGKALLNARYREEYERYRGKAR
ncbi:hemerythrin domain-containing protein [Pseudopontixanthobacter vadosimaris]|uniref:hemerythrin domain-containing protein n=1 Tax=Pseudopontixanthobacter vadosimaris TaxID=2726450 RepID=UPI0014732F23|nr:hemerythrin domain-containing protein [Pseudopontixanthobacter vadosimaris]